jgi:hypothetical protein
MMGLEQDLGNKEEFGQDGDGEEDDDDDVLVDDRRCADDKDDDDNDDEEEFGDKDGNECQVPTSSTNSF